MDEWHIERLDASHERSDFCCGEPSLDQFLRSLVTQYEKRRLGRTYVAVAPGAKRVSGYYTLAAGSVAVERLPPDKAKKLPKHPVPTLLLGRLAVDQSARGRRLGERLLVDALERALEVAGQVGLFAVEVAALNAGAKAFYEKYGFVPLVDNELHLYLPVKTLESRGDSDR